MARVNQGAVWHALADPSRRRLLDLLRSGPRTTSALCGHFDMSRNGVMKHLDILEDACLINVRRKGRERWNYINATPLRAIYERWLTPFQQLWASSIAQIGMLVEGEAMPSIKTDRPIAHDEIVQTVEFSVPAERVFTALTRDVAKWWSHLTYDHDGPPQLTIELTAGGRFLETRGTRQRLYGTVTRVEPPALLVLEGAMGMSGCLFAKITFAIETAGSGSRLTLTHEVVGVYDDETIEMYRGGWGSLLANNLKQYVERGVEAWGAA